MLPLMDGPLRPFVLVYPVIAILLVDPVMVSMTGASPGHRILGISIQDAKTGNRIGLLRAIFRSLMRGTLGWLSLVFVLTSRKHQAIHDLICRTVVVLCVPEQFPSYEKYSERITEIAGYKYPSRTRRFLVILVYVVLIFLLVGVLNVLTSSEACLTYGKCGTVDEIVSVALNLAFMFGVGVAIVFGWKARLFGCRKKEAASPGAEP